MLCYFLVNWSFFFLALKLKSMRRFKEGRLNPAEAMKECKTLVLVTSLFDNQFDIFFLLEHNKFVMLLQRINDWRLFSFIYCPSEFGDVERCVKVCTGVWIRDFLAHLILLCQRLKFQVTQCSNICCTCHSELPESKSVDRNKMWQKLPNNLLCQTSEFCSTITAASYAGLIYLGLRFLRKSILNR